MTLVAQSLSLQDFLRLPYIEESPAWELINWVPVQKPMPTLYHSRLQKKLVGAIDQADSPYEAFPELRCILSQSSVVPDIAVVHQDRIPKSNQAIDGTPDWAIKILSPDQRMTGVIAKLKVCLQEGMQLGWLVDPQEEVVLVFWPDRRLDLLKDQDLLPVLPMMSLDLTVSQVFDWLQSREGERLG